MPDIASTSDTNDTLTESVLFRIRATTRPDLPAEMVLAFVQSSIDLLALGIAAATGHVKFEHPGAPPTGAMGIRISSDPAYSVPPRTSDIETVVVDAGQSEWVIAPPYAAISTVRSELLIVRRLSYNNPIEIEALAALSGREGGQVVEFLKFLNTAGAQRRTANALATEAEVSAAIADSTMEIAIDEKFEMLERSQLDNMIRKSELDTARLAHKEKQLELALRVIEAQWQLAQMGLPLSAWGEDDAKRFLDNVRLIASIDLTDILEPEITVETEE